MKRFYLAYGSNLNLRDMSYRCKKAIPIGSTVLMNYRLVYKGSIDGYAYLTIELSKDSLVPVGIFNISFFDELRLNKYEGYPELYYKEHFPINIGNKEAKALIYIMKDNFDYHLPNDQYIDTCMMGYDYFGFDKKVLEDAFDYTKRKILANNYSRD